MGKGGQGMCCIWGKRRGRRDGRDLVGLCMACDGGFSGPDLRGVGNLNCGHLRDFCVRRCERRAVKDLDGISERAAKIFEED